MKKAVNDFENMGWFPSHVLDFVRQEFEGID